MYHGVLVFIDDILIYSETWKEHLDLVDEVLHRLSDHNYTSQSGKVSLWGEADKISRLNHFVQES